MIKLLKKYQDKVAHFVACWFIVDVVISFAEGKHWDEMFFALLGLFVAILVSYWKESVDSEEKGNLIRS